MIRVKRILCPTDFSTESMQAIPYAVEMARVFDAEIYLDACASLAAGAAGALRLPKRAGRAFFRALYRRGEAAGQDRLGVAAERSTRKEDPGGGSTRGRDPQSREEP